MRQFLKYLIILVICLSANITSAQQITTYSYVSGLITPAATPTDVFVLTGSSGNKLVMVSNISCWGTATTQATVELIIYRRVTADTLGTSTAVTALNLVGSNQPPTSSVVYYTANPTLGTLPTGNPIAKALPLNVGPTSAGFTSFDFGTLGTSPLILRSSVHQAVVYLNSATLPSGFQISCTFQVAEQ